jgi:hypothetical protein
MKKIILTGLLSIGVLSSLHAESQSEDYKLMAKGIVTNSNKIKLLDAKIESLVISTDNKAVLEQNAALKRDIENLRVQVRGLMEGQREPVVLDEDMRRELLETISK